MQEAVDALVPGVAPFTASEELAPGERWEACYSGCGKLRNHPRWLVRQPHGNASTELVGSFVGSHQSDMDWAMDFGRRFITPGRDSGS
ncbi:uncharacterized protein SAZU_3670 [Streptomyces azureus]|uniref:Uncharacterized protein n=1 Tax=Streptomyces azureus TaxID=146537 RepID=A0A0K8PLN9_STRAJ|nr:uncharacterized protein SAZU_3670 [Streptomyces azureus]